MNGENNEHVRLAEIKGLASKNIGAAFREMKAVSLGTRCKNFFYHANINPRDDEALTPEQWEKAVVSLEKRLGLEGQARFIVEHEKKGRIHRHIIWSRIDVDRMRAIPNDDDFEKHQEVSRQLEKEFGLSRVPSVLGKEVEKGKRPKRRPKTWEVFRGERSGLSVFDAKEEVTRLWNAFEKSDEFISALESNGYILARGDSRNFCIVDRNGDVHSLARRVDGAKAADIRERLADVDPNRLPHVNEAAAVQRQRSEQEKGKEQSGGSEQERLIAPREQFKAQADRQVEQAEEMKLQQQRLEDYKRAITKQAEEARLEEERRKQKDAAARAREGEVRNPNYRYGMALAQHYDIRDPYGSLARSAMAEYGSFLRDRENLDRQIAKATDPVERQKLEIRREIESAEYMAITSQRIAGQSEIITGRLNSPDALRQRERAEGFQKQAQALRREYREIVSSKDQGQETASPGQREERGQETGKPSLMVEKRVPGKPPGPEQKLEDFVKNLPDKPQWREFSKDELRNNPEAKRAHSVQQKDEKNRTIALESISRNLKTGKNLNTADVARLSREDLDGIKKQGDSHLKGLVQQHERDRDRGRGLER